MTEKLQSLYNDMDRKIIEKTSELRENIQDLDRQNQAIANVLKEMKEKQEDSHT
jgi:nitrate/nitrite-specific signal transduction histidine kinase